MGANAADASAAGEIRSNHFRPSFEFMSTTTIPDLTSTTVGTPVHASERKRRLRRPRILLVTPELNGSRTLAKNGPEPRAKAGGLADVSTLLVDELSARSIDVHVAMPDFRSLIPESGRLSRRLHLCPDREFFYRRSVYEGSRDANLRAALAFQRDIIHNVLPRVKPDIVHCHDWMTALIPAAARQMGIPSLFTLHNTHDERVSLSVIEDRGIDAAGFWQHLHYQSYPGSYQETRNTNPVNFLASAIHAADYVNTVSPTFLEELIEGLTPLGGSISDVLRGKLRHGAAEGILNAPDPSYDPERDPALIYRYGPGGHAKGKCLNKIELQRTLGLEEEVEAPMLFWPSRLDPTQKGCGLFSEILYRLVSDYWGLGLQVVFVADGPFRGVFDHIAGFHGLRHRIAVCGFDEMLSRRAYAASDFVIVPSSYEPCGLAQMVALKYGSLPIVHRTGGLSDTVKHLEGPDSGNGFVFEHHDPDGLRWAIDQAIRFHIGDRSERERTVTRIMQESRDRFSPDETARAYVRIYEKLSHRPIDA